MLLKIQYDIGMILIYISSPLHLILFDASEISWFPECWALFGVSKQEPRAPYQTQGGPKYFKRSAIGPRSRQIGPMWGHSIWPFAPLMYTGKKSNNYLCWLSGVLSVLHLQTMEFLPQRDLSSMEQMPLLKKYLSMGFFYPKLRELVMVLEYISHSRSSKVWILVPT